MAGELGVQYRPVQNGNAKGNGNGKIDSALMNRFKGKFSEKGTHWWIDGERFNGKKLNSNGKMDNTKYEGTIKYLPSGGNYNLEFRSIPGNGASGSGNGNSWQFFTLTPDGSVLDQNGTPASREQVNQVKAFIEKTLLYKKYDERYPSAILPSTSKTEIGHYF